MYVYVSMKLNKNLLTVYLKFNLINYEYIAKYHEQAELT